MRKIFVAASHFSELCPEQKAYLTDNGYRVEENPGSGPLSQKELIQQVVDSYAVFVGLEVWNKEVFTAAENLRILCRWGVGVDNIDLDEARNQGVVVVNAAGCNHISVAEHAVGLMLSIVRRIPFYDKGTKLGGWDRSIATEITGRTVGIVGLGRIGRAVAKLLKGFDVRILAHDEVIDTVYCRENAIEVVSIEELLRYSSIVSLHIPETDKTHHIINRSTLKLMQHGAYIINTSRGGLIDEKALMDALKKGPLSGAALDVFEYEPTKKGNPLFSLDNIIVTPHISAFTRQTFSNVAWSCIRALEQVVAGDEPDNRIV